MMFPARNLELYFWNNEIGDMDCLGYDLDWERDLMNIDTIDIVLMDYPICDEVAIVTYIGDHPLPLDVLPLYITSEQDDNKVLYTVVVYSPNPDYNDILISDTSVKEAARYTLYSRFEGINRIERFRLRDNPVDIPNWTAEAEEE